MLNFFTKNKQQKADIEQIEKEAITFVTSMQHERYTSKLIMNYRFLEQELCDNILMTHIMEFANDLYKYLLISNLKNNDTIKLSNFYKLVYENGYYYIKR